MDTNISTLPDTWENRIEQTAKVLGLTTEKVEEILATKGFEITKESYGLQMLSDEEVTPFGDLRKLFCEENGIAVPKLRMAIKFLRGPKNSQKTTEIDPDVMGLQKKYGIQVNLEDLDAEELLPLYRPSKKNAIYTVLSKKFGDKAIIAFKPDTTEVALEETLNYIVDIESGLPEEESIEVDGELVRLYPVGQVPNQTVEEDPIYEGVPLKRGRSLENRINWTGVSKEIRQFVRILVDRGEISRDRLVLSQLIKKTLKELKDIYPESYLVFKEMKTKDELPKLVISINDVKTASGRSNNPFGINKRY